MFCSYLILSNTLPNTNHYVTYNANNDDDGISTVRLRILCFIFTITILSMCD